MTLGQAQGPEGRPQGGPRMRRELPHPPALGATRTCLTSRDSDLYPKGGDGHPTARTRQQGLKRSFSFRPTSGGGAGSAWRSLTLKPICPVLCSSSHMSYFYSCFMDDNWAADHGPRMQKMLRHPGRGQEKWSRQTGEPGRPAVPTGAPTGVPTVLQVLRLHSYKMQRVPEWGCKVGGVF